MTVRVLRGDCRALLPTLPAGSVQCVVTSPPYFGLRSYLPEGHPDKVLEIGLERSPEEFVDELVTVFREVWRVLRDDGVVWLNLGDSYAGSSGAQGRGGPPSASSTLRGNGHVGGGPKLKSLSAVQIAAAPKNASHTGLIRMAGVKPKDLYGIPWMVAFALRADGWYLRSNVIWHKPAPMPESTDDRPTSAHEHVFLLAKSGEPLFWMHRDGTGTRRQPPPDYRWVDRDNGDAETRDEPANWRDELSCSPARGRRWSRINLWSSEDYFYDAQAIAEVSSGRASA